MARPRTHDSKLPKYVRIKSGAYYYRDIKLCRVDQGESAMYDALAKRKAEVPLHMLPAAVTQYKLEYLKTLSISAGKEHGRILDVFSNEFSEYRVDEVSPIDIKRSIRNLYPEALSAARAYKSRISTFFSWCVTEAGLCKINPCREVRTKKPPKRKTKWTVPLFYSMREALPEMLQCYHDLSYYLYQRTTEVRLLERSQVDRAAGLIRFLPTKTEDSSGAGVDIPITPEIAAVLDAAATISKKQKIVCPYVIHSRDGDCYTRSGIYSHYLRADKKLHGEDDYLGLNPKALRPFAATQAERQGYTMREIQTGLVHAIGATTEGYVQQHGTPVSALRLQAPKP